MINKAAGGTKTVAELPIPCNPGDNCSDAMNKVYSYIDGWSDEEQASEIREHLTGCDDCHEVYSFHRQLKSLISTGCRSEMPPELHSRILDAIACYEPDDEI